MTFATDKQLQASDRFVLARLNPARFINDDLVLVSLDTYQATFESIKNVSVLERNGAGLTEVTTITGNDEYTFDEQTGVLTIQLADAPDEDTNVIVLFHFLYLTTEQGRYFGSDPLVAVSDSNPERLWEARLTRSPVIEEAYKNIVNAVLTIKASSLSINNADQFLNPFLTLDDSFKNKTVELYIGINDSLEKIFTGPMNDVSIRDVTATVAFRDAFSKVNDLATFGSSVAAAFYTSAEFGNLDPSSTGLTKVTNIGKGSPGRHKTSDRVVNVVGTTPDKKYAEIDAFNKAVNTDYNATDLTLNRNWHMLRTRVPFDTQTLGTLVRQTTATIRGDTVHFYNFSAANLVVGQTFKWDDGGGPYYAIVHHVGAFSSGGLDYNVMVANNGNINLGDPIMTDVNDFLPLTTLAVAIFRPGATATSSTFTNVYLKEEENYDLTLLSFINGMSEYRVELDAGISLDPDDNDGIIWQGEFESGTFSQAPGHAEAVSNILTRAGIDINSTSFSDAQTALDIDVRTQVPAFGSSNLPSYRELLQDIMGSALTFLFQNEDGEAEYGILEAPAAGDTRDDSLILAGSQSVKYNYNDIFQTIRFSNVHDNFQNDGDTPVDVTDNKSTFLHGEERIKEFQHVLNDFDDRQTEHLEIRSSRQADYQYSIATEDIDSDLAKDITLDSDKITPSGTENVKITSIKRSADRVQVKATDLGELS